QWQDAGQLQQLARVLRLPSDELSALKEARAKIDDALAKQEEIRNEIKQQEEKDKDDARPEPNIIQTPAKGLTFPDLQALPKLTPGQANKAERQAFVEKSIADAVNSEKNAKLADKQAKIAFDTNDTANLLKPFVPDAAKTVENAEKAMAAAKSDLLK